MSKTKSKEVEIVINHPLEDVFDIEEGTTLVTRTEQTTELVVADEYDGKDIEIEDQLQVIVDLALASYEDLSVEFETTEGKYKARIGEVANQTLTTALNAVKEKANMKLHKDKLEVSKGKSGAKTINNNLIVADRNEILKRLLDNGDES